MAQAPPTYEVRDGDGPLWASQPFRVFFPFGIVAAVFGLALWPLHYAGWWPLYPAIQHPRILIFGFGAAFVFGFLGTAWPRFLGSAALGRSEVTATALTWLLAQILYARGAISGGDLAMALAATGFLLILGRRLFAEGREWRLRDSHSLFSQWQWGPRSFWPGRWGGGANRCLGAIFSASSRIKVSCCYRCWEWGPTSSPAFSPFRVGPARGVRWESRKVDPGVR